MGRFPVDDKTYMVSNQRRTETLDTADSPARAFPDLNIAYAGCAAR